MKDIDKKDVTDVSGGYVPTDGGCFPPFPEPIDFPKTPGLPMPEPMPGPGDPTVFDL